MSRLLPESQRVRIATLFGACLTLVTAGFAQTPITMSSIWATSPSSIVQGKTTEVILTAPANACGPGAGQLADATLSNAVNPPIGIVQAGFGVTAENPKHTGTCELTVSLGPATNAKTGPMRLTLSKAAGGGAAAVPIGFATITITSSLALPIPDGLSPQVDIDWHVLGFQQTYDNFGRRIADNYYAVEITLGNNTGFPLQLSGAGFDLKNPDAAPTPTTNQMIVQGSLLYGQDYSARNVIYRTLVWAALIGAGANPYFHSANAKANYSAGLALFSGPLVNGFLQQFPDNTVKQLARLNSSDVMGDQNIIPNNSQVPFIAFVTRDSVCHQVRDSNICGSRKRLHMVHVPYSTDAVKEALGNITIVGKTIPIFGARIKVTAAPTGAQPTTGTVNGSVLEGVASSVTLMSSGLTGASVTSAPHGVTVDTTTGPFTDSSFTASILTLTKAPISLTLTRKDGTLITFPVSVEQPIPIIQYPPGTKTIPVGKPTSVTITWQSKGPSLIHAALPAMAAADGISALVAPTIPSLSVTINPARAGSLNVPLTVPVALPGAGTANLPDLPPLAVSVQ